MPALRRRLHPHLRGLRVALGAGVAAGLLSGCANCTIFSSSTACNMQMAGLLVLAAPAVPFVLAKEALDDHRSDRAHARLLAQVDSGDVEASFRCLMVCGAGEPQRGAAARQVLAAHAAVTPEDGRAQAALMLAHKQMADALWRDDPQARVAHLEAVLRIGGYPAMWALVRRADNGLPVNDNRFRSEADAAAREVLMLRQIARAQAAGDARLPFECDTRGLAPLRVQRGASALDLACRSAQRRWEVRALKD